MSIRRRVTLYGLGVVILVLIIITVLFGLLVLGSVPQTQDKELAARANAAVSSLERATPGDLAAPADLPASGTPAGRVSLAPIDGATSDEIMLIVLDANGTVLSSTGVVAGAPPPVPAGLLDRARSSGATAGTIAAAGVSLRVQVRPWQRADLNRSGYVVAAQGLHRQKTDRQGFVAVLIVADLIALVAASVGIWFVAGRALRPLRELTAMADEVGRSADLSRRLPEVSGRAHLAEVLPGGTLGPEVSGRVSVPSGHPAVAPGAAGMAGPPTAAAAGPAVRASQRDELGRLTASFNAMMARLQEAYGRMANALAAQQRFTADASHELRTPLTTVRSNAGFLRTHPEADDDDRAAALADIEAEGERMARLVDDLLTLARADGGQRLSRSTVDVGALAHEVCRQAGGLHAKRKFHCAGAPVTLLGDADALRRLLWILVDNAVAHTEDDGTVWVAVTRHGTAATLQVSDDGTGIPSGLESRVFDRFFRADPARGQTGSGLGLSIAQWIAREHGGHIAASNNERGGASFVVQLPLPTS